MTWQPEQARLWACHNSKFFMSYAKVLALKRTAAKLSYACNLSFIVRKQLTLLRNVYVANIISNLLQ